MEFSHKSVLLFESINSLQINPEGLYVDGTIGGAGHSVEIAKRLTTGRLIGFDKDPDAVEIAIERLKGYPASVFKSDFKEIAIRLDELGIDKVNGILLDLGVSSWQLDNAERGFSYHKDAPLDMRMSKQGVTAYDLVNTMSVKQLTEIFREYGEEKFAYKIAKSIERARNEESIKTTVELAEIIRKSVPAAARRGGHPARKCFQALRIMVNSELDSLSEGLDAAFSKLAVGGILSVITFHSLEDRIVKRRFFSWCKGCKCPPEIPVCVCGQTPIGELVTRKPIDPTAIEVSENARSRSAKLRAIRRIQ